MMKDPISFASIDLFEEEEGLPVPSREEAGLPLREAVSDPLADLKRERRFVKEARARAFEQGGEAAYVPFMSYWPTYDQMNAAQQAWYFYWRSEVRSGRYPRTDLSYLFVHIYELINGVGFTEPSEGLEQLNRLWDAYETEYPRISHYMKDWLFDFALVHRLGSSLSGLLERAGDNPPPELAALELMKGLDAPQPLLTMELLLPVSDYDVRRSRFFQSGGGEDMNRIFPKVVLLADAYLRKTTGASLADRYASVEAKLSKRYLFRSAVYDQSLYGSTLDVYTIPVSSHPPFRKLMTNLLRFTENKLRELNKFRGRLKDVELEAGLAKVINRYLEQEFNEDSAANRPEPIVIDPHKLTILQQDTELVRHMLTTEGQADEPVTEQSSYLPETADRIFGSESKADLLSAAVNMPDEKSCGLKLEASKDNCEERYEFKLKDENRAEPLTGRADSGLTVDSLRLDEVENSPESADKGGAEPLELLWNTSGLEAEWVELARMLNECQLKALQVLREEAAEQALHRIAGEYGTMPELIIDQINDTAMMTVGDLVIEDMKIVEDYLPYFDGLKGWSE